MKISLFCLFILFLLLSACTNTTEVPTNNEPIQTKISALSKVSSVGFNEDIVKKYSNNFDFELNDFEKTFITKLDQTISLFNAHYKTKYKCNTDYLVLSTQKSKFTKRITNLSEVEKILNEITTQLPYDFVKTKTVKNGISSFNTPILQQALPEDGEDTIYDVLMNLTVSATNFIGVEIYSGTMNTSVGFSKGKQVYIYPRITYSTIVLSPWQVTHKDETYSQNGATTGYHWACLHWEFNINVGYIITTPWTVSSDNMILEDTCIQPKY